jgi:DNA polymerase III subunit gamma/tau
MENFIVSARKYRPVTFDSVVGQQSITTTLRNAIKNNHLAQAYLFCGPRGVGKTTCARIFAKTINCFNITSQVEACNECESCKSFTESRSYNIHELDAASNNSVDDIRSLIDQVRIPPQVGKYSIYIIDEVHMLSAQAFNAFLKTLEEPPRHAVFILATTEKHKIIPTILSRCQIFDFNRIQIEDTVQYLEKISKNEGNEYEHDALNIIAQKADGAMRDALSIYDQIVSFSGGKVTYKNVIENLNILDYDYYFKLTDAFMNGNVAEAFLSFNEILNDGFDAHNFINGLSKHFRDLLVCKDVATIQLLEVGVNIKEKYKQQSASSSVDFLFEALQICNSCDLNFKSSRNQRLHVELALVQLCQVMEKKKSPDGPLEEVPESLKVVEASTISPVSTQPKVTIPSPAVNNSTSKTVSEAQKKVIPYASSISIKSIIKEGNGGSIPSPVKNIENDNIENGDEQLDIKDQDFNLDQLSNAYSRFVESIKEEKPRMFNSLNTQHPQLSGRSLVKLTMSNSTQEEDFNKNIRIDLLRFLSNELQNDTITIEIQVEESQQQSMLYTSEEKFKHMLEKNPNLGKLKQKWNLDFE